MSILRNTLVVAIPALVISATAAAGVSKDLPYPSGGNLTADQIIDQVYFVNHFYANKNYSIQKEGKDITVLLLRTKGKKAKGITLQRFLNNNYSDGSIKARDMAFFHSGKLKGTGMLVTDYEDDSKSQSYAIWLPQLRKIRRFAQPGHDDAWGGSDFTFGDVTLRKPQNETHELLGKEKFKECLGFMDNVKSKYLKKSPGGACVEAEVYKVKSTTKFKNWWYDYRIGYVDAKTFGDYRTEYFKDGEQIKVIDRNWGSFGDSDPRSLYWKYWYGKSLVSGHETWAVIPEKASFNNEDRDNRFWSEATLRKIKR